MEQQQNDSAKRDAQFKRLKKHIAVFDVIINHLIQTYHYERRIAGTIPPFGIGLPNPGVCDEYDSDATLIAYDKRSIKYVESCQSDDCATGAVDDDLKAWDTEFVKVDQATLFDLIHAAHYLDIESLSKLTCKTFLDMTRGNTQEEFKRAFKLLMHTV